VYAEAHDTGRAHFHGGDAHLAVSLGEVAVARREQRALHGHENLNAACRSALLNMIALLRERGFTREQAYVVCSVAVDLRISNVVDVPNYVVSALLPEGIFRDDPGSPRAPEPRSPRLRHNGRGPGAAFAASGPSSDVGLAGAWAGCGQAGPPDPSQRVRGRKRAPWPRGNPEHGGDERDQVGGADPGRHGIVVAVARLRDYDERVGWSA